MEISSHYPSLNSSPRALAMVLALVSAIVLSPLYVDSGKSERRLEGRWSSGGLVLPAVVAGLIVAIKTTNNGVQKRASAFESSENNGGIMLRIGSSSWGLAGILVMLLFVVSWQGSVQHFFWR
ncbi:hypothetical protein CDL12_04973 [Handroanthus impetiginosus]|uniref:Uncharacterized protein n=1 Tax=Handroanthus impetiginosus TaxID=429701 RepID=A0A2G9HY97_9LAMI|nr:hypothetical protein CDL12_04973 [Handroanthus impetiginosus]